MKSNMGTSDRIIRILAAVTIIALWYFGVLENTWAIALLFIAGIFIATSLISYCPLYFPFGFSTAKEEAIDYEEVLANGGSLVDVRSKREFENEHLAEAINIPLDQLGVNLWQLPDKLHPIVVCCASGTRSASAKKLLEENGYSQVYNGGSWMSIRNKI